MPPKRSTRHSSGPATKGSQQTLAFSSSKVSKPSTPTATTSQKSKLAQSISSLTPEDIDTKDVGHVSSEAATAQQASAEVERVSKKEERTEEEERAAKVTDAQIRKYWRERENERRAPRVHQQELGVEEKVLRLFDISSQYGVCHFLLSLEALWQILDGGWLSQRHGLTRTNSHA